MNIKDGEFLMLKKILIEWALLYYKRIPNNRMHYLNI